MRTESAERAHTRTATYTGRSVELVESLEVARNANDLKRRCAHTRRGTTSQAPDSRRMHMRAASHGTSPDGARAGCLELSVQREGVGAPTNYTTGRVCSARTSAGGRRTTGVAPASRASHASALLAVAQSTKRWRASTATAAGASRRSSHRLVSGASALLQEAKAARSCRAAAPPPPALPRAPPPPPPPPPPRCSACSSSQLRLAPVRPYRRRACRDGVRATVRARLRLRDRVKGDGGGPGLE